MKIITKIRRKNPTFLLIASLVLIFFLPAAWYLTTHPFGAKAAWFNDQWSYRKEIPVTAHTSTETNVYLNLTGAAALDTSDTTKFQTDCGDLRFTNVRGEELKYYLVSGCGSATTVVHVLVPDFPAGAQTFYYYYGNPTASNGTEPADFSTAASGVTIGAFGSEEKSPAPVAYWKFDEGYGTSAADSAGHNNSGSISGATWQTEDLCISGKCLFFDGTNDAVSIGTTVPSVQTVSFWIKPATTTEQFIALSGSANITASSGTLSATGFTSPTIYVDGRVSSTIVASRWQHIAVTTGSAITASAVTISQVATDYGQSLIDDVKFYQYARSASEIKTDFNAGKAHAASAKGTSQSYSSAANNDALSDGLVGYWKMNESSGDAADSSGNSYALTNNAIATFVSGKFGNAGNLVSASSQFFSTAANLGSVNTIAFWVYPTSNTTYLIDLDGTRTITASSGTISANSFTSPTIYVNGLVSSTLIANVWQHITVTTTNSITTNSFKVGKVGSNFFDGKIDEFRLFNRALQPSEVAFLYNFAPGPVGYWKLDENTGGSAYDSSSRSFTATWGGTGNHWSQGKFGSAGQFNGSDDTLSAGNQTDLQVTTDLTVSLWINAKTIGNNEYLFAYSTDGETQATNNLYSLRWSTTSGNDLFYEHENGAGVNTTNSFDTNLSSNTWYHISLVRDSINKTVKLNINGIQTTSTFSYTNNADGGTAGEFSLGIRNPSSVPTGYFDGRLDDVRVYNYIRTQKQIIEDMNAGHPAPGSPVGSYVARFKFDDLSGTTAQDTSSNNNDLTLSTASWTTNGKFDGAWNGTGAVWLSRSDDPDFDFTATEDFSASFWFKSDSDANPAATEYLVNKASVTSAGYAIYANTSGQICFAIDDDATWDPDVASCTSADYYDGLWHQVIGMRDTTADTTSIYIDGISRDSDTDTTTATLANALSLFVGDRDGIDNGDEFVGDLDELKVFRSALTAEQIKLDYNQGSSQVLGSLSTASDGTTASNSAERSYCIPGDTSTCSAPTGEWRFEEGSGNSTNDTSGNNKTGTLNSFASAAWKPGKVGKSLDFDGSSSYINVPTPSLPTSDFTYETWVNLDDNTDETVLMAADGAGNNEFVIYVLNTNQWRVLLNDVIVLVSNSTIPKNTWTHLAVTRSGTTLTLYQNGRYDNSTSNSSSLNFGSCDLLIGVDADASCTGSLGNYADGRIDDVRIFNYGRSVAQIAYDYNHGGPLVRYRFDECQGTTAFNAIPNSNGAAAGMNGTIAPGSSGNTAVGTCTISATTMWYNGRTGKLNSALDFDGTDDNVTIASTTPLQITGDITVSAWINVASYANNDYIFAHSTDGETQATNNLYSFRFNTGSGNDLLYEHENGAGNNTVNTFDTNLSTSTWYHFVMVRDTTANTIKIFVNGIQRDSTYTYTNDPDGGGSGYLTIGARNALDVSLGFMDGLIDDFQIFPYALTQVQIKNLYNNGAVRYGPTTGSP